MVLCYETSNNYLKHKNIEVVLQLGGKSKVISKTRYVVGFPG